MCKLPGACVCVHYLLQAVQGVVEFPPPVQRQKPHLLPPADQEVDLRVLGLNGGLRGRLVQGLGGGALSCGRHNQHSVEHGPLPINRLTGKTGLKVVDTCSCVVKTRTDLAVSFKTKTQVGDVEDVCFLQEGMT